MKTFIAALAIVAATLTINTPTHAVAKTVKKKTTHHVVHHRVHHRKLHATAAGSSSVTPTSVDAQSANTVAAETSAPQTTSGKVVSHVKSAGHKISYNTWKLTHPNQARAEYDAEQAADAKREAADKAHEAQYNKTH